MTKDMELLAPAGNIEKLKTAFRFGADAVYLGVADFSLRVRVNDLDEDMIARATQYSRDMGKKIYVTLNIFAHNSHLEILPRHIKSLKEIGVDALIVSDPGIIRIVREMWKEAPIHLSTQANCINWSAAKFWEEQGVERIILGRETKLDDIKRIKKECPGLELEYFVHGAMCVAYSGRCFLSKYFLGRSGNLGDCAQSCRWKYYISEEKRPEERLEMAEDKHGSYILNSHDLCLVEHLDKLQKAGVDSVKIEGRNKSIYYLATVCGIYRDAINSLKEGRYNKRIDFWRKELEEKLFHRGYTTGFLLGEDAGELRERHHEESDWEFCGEVTDVREKDNERYLEIKVHNSMKKGDKIEIVSPFYQVNEIFLGDMEEAGTGKQVEEAHGGGSEDVVRIKGEKGEKGSVLRRKRA